MRDDTFHAASLWLGALTASSLFLAHQATAQASLPVRDSAGVRIVEHGVLPGRTAPFRIDPAVRLELGGLREDLREEIDARTPFLVARPLSDGRWIVVDWASLKLFDGQGRLVRIIGRSGSGPGEFRQVRDVCVSPGDTLIAVTVGDRRIVAFDSAGHHLRTSLLDGTSQRSPCMTDGSVLVARESRPNPARKLPTAADSMLDRVVPVNRVRWDGTTVALGLMQAGSLDQTIRERANLTAAGERIYVGSGATPEYRVYGVKGQLEQVVRWQAPRRVISTEERAAARARGYAAGPVARPAYPYYFSSVAGPEETVWVEDYAVYPAVAVGYTIFDRRGAFLGRIELPRPSPSPSPIEIAWIGRDRVVLGWRDEDGAPHLTVHALESRVIPAPRR